MKKAVLSMIVLLVASPAVAQLSASFSEYFEGPEGFLLTKKEKKAWKQVTSDAEAEEFIALFWAKRDPDPSTAVNELRIDFYRKVEAADQFFGHGTTRGALSDRAYVLYLLGRWSRRDVRPPGAAATDVRDPADASVGPERLVPSSTLYWNRGATEIWEYRGEHLQIRPGQYFLHAVFLETDVDENDFILDRNDSQLMRVLGGMPQLLVANPDLTEVPEIGLIPGTRPASAEQISWLKDDPVPWPHPARARVASGVAPGPRHFLWAHVRMAESSADAESVVGRVRDAKTGEVLGSFVVPFQDVTIGERTLELSIPVAEGNWLLDVAVAREGGSLSSGTFRVETIETEVGRTAVAPFVWGVEVRQVEKSAIGDPFTIGGWRVEPVLDSRFLTSSTGNLSYMTCVFDPELDSEGNPQFTVTLSLSKDGRQVAKTQPQPAPLVKLMDGVWMFGRGLPLPGFSKPGSYLLSIELEQTTDGTKGAVEIPFEMVQGEPASDETM